MYGMGLEMWFKDGPLIIYKTGSSCDNILTVVLDIVGKGHDYVILACEILVVV